MKFKVNILQPSNGWGKKTNQEHFFSSKAKANKFKKRI